MDHKPTLSLEPTGIRLDPRKGLAQQLYQALRERILDGRMASRMRLPASHAPAYLPKPALKYPLFGHTPEYKLHAEYDPGFSKY